MARYIQFTARDGSMILIEVEEEEIIPQRGMVKAGIKDKVQDTIAVAQVTLEEAMARVVHHNVAAFLQSVRNLPDPPNQVEMTFGLKATGEVGNVAVGKLGGEANYTVKMVWRAEAKETP